MSNGLTLCQIKKIWIILHIGDKAWTRVYHKIYENSEANKAKLADDVKWLKGKGVIKEASDEPIQSSGNSLEGSGLSNL